MSRWIRRRGNLADWSQASHPYWVVVQINNQPLSMEIDTGAAVNVKSKHLFPNAHFNKYPCRPDGGRTGVCQLHWPLRGITGVCQLHWLSQALCCWWQLSITFGLQLASAPSLVLGEHSFNRCTMKFSCCGGADYQVCWSVSRGTIGTMRDIQASLKVQEGATPHFCRPRTNPLAIKEAVGRKLDQLEADGILRKVDHG